jgi:hypothetical protein
VAQCRAVVLLALEALEVAKFLVQVLRRVDRVLHELDLGSDRDHALLLLQRGERAVAVVALVAAQPASASHRPGRVVGIERVVHSVGVRDRARVVEGLHALGNRPKLVVRKHHGRKLSLGDRRRLDGLLGLLPAQAATGQHERPGEHHSPQRSRHALGFGAARGEL